MQASSDFKHKLSRDLFFVRGVAIFLVVIGHVIGDRNSGIRQLYYQDITGLAWSYSFIYTFHLPVFFILSGISFAVFSKSNVTFVEFIRSKSKRLIIPWICWTPLFCIFRSLSSREDLTLLNIINSTLNADFIFWFFPALLFAALLAFSILKLSNSSLVYYIVSVILLISASYIGGRVSVWFQFNIFYAFGFCIASALSMIYSLVWNMSRRKVFLVILLTISTMLLTNLLVGIEYLSIGFSQYVNGPLAFLLIYLGAVRGRLLFWFKMPENLLFLVRSSLIHLGKISMGIYLLHIFFGSATRIFLVKFSIASSVIHLLLGTLVSIISSVLIHDLLERRSKFYLFSIGELK